MNTFLTIALIVSAIFLLIGIGFCVFVVWVGFNMAMNFRNHVEIEDEYFNG